MYICTFIGRDAEMNSRIVFKLHIKTDQPSAVEVSGIICETTERGGGIWERVYHGTYLLGTIDVYQASLSISSQTEKWLYEFKVSTTFFSLLTPDGQIDSLWNYSLLEILILHPFFCGVQSKILLLFFSWPLHAIKHIITDILESL